MTIECTWEEFKRMSMEFHNSVDSLNLEELDNAWKCLGLAYLGMNEEMWSHSAAMLLKMESKSYFSREYQLMGEVESA